MFKGLFKKDPIKNFWNWFLENRGRIEKISDWNDPVVAQITKELRKIDKDLCWETGNSTLTISAGGNLRLFPIVEEVVKRAPQVEGWNISAFKQPQGEPEITMGSMTFRAAELKVKLVPIQGRFGVYVYFPDYQPHGPHAEIAMLLIDATLGEKVSANNIIDLVCRTYTPDCESLPTILELRSRFGVPEPAGN